MAQGIATEAWRRCRHFSLDAQDPEAAYQRELHDHLNPEKLFDRRWAETLVNRAISRLKKEWESFGRPFEKLKGFLTDPSGTRQFAEVAMELETTESALKASVHRLRKRYGEIFHEEVAQTVAGSEEVDEEIRYLLSSLSA